MASLLQDVPVLGQNVGMTATAFGIIAVIYTMYRVVSAVGEYEGLGLPLAGEPDGKKKFSFKTRLRYYYDCAALYTEAYHKVRRCNQIE
jgi:hypothetical protein